MSSDAPKSARPLPIWLAWLGSLLAVGHLLTIGLLALAAQSGPWLMSNGQPSPVFGPHFATTITSEFTEPYYLQPLRMTHNYHFETNKPVALGIYFAVRLKDESGATVKTLKFPDEQANFWVRHRQSILAQGLGNDQFVAPPGSRQVAAPKKELPTVEVWEPVDKENLRLAKIDVLDLKSDRQYERPSEGAKALAQSYMRHLCRQHNAASAELIRHHQRAIRPEKLIVNIEPDDFLEIRSHFGEYHREK